MNNDKIIKVELENYILFDEINILAAEYSTTTDVLINIAIQRLLNDVEFVRGLRIGNFEITRHQDGQK